MSVERQYVSYNITINSSIIARQNLRKIFFQRALLENLNFIFNEAKYYAAVKKSKALHSITKCSSNPVSIKARRVG
jgi:hypothetical protein